MTWDGMGRSVCWGFACTDQIFALSWWGLWGEFWWRKLRSNQTSVVLLGVCTEDIGRTHPYCLAVANLCRESESQKPGKNSTHFARDLIFHTFCCPPAQLSQAQSLSVLIPACSYSHPPQLVIWATRIKEKQIVLPFCFSELNPWGKIFSMTFSLPLSRLGTH